MLNTMIAKHALRQCYRISKATKTISYTTFFFDTQKLIQTYSSTHTTLLYAGK